MPGGSAQKIVDGSDGESGKAGGGGGYRGGSGGTWVVHQHDGLCRHIHQGDAVRGGGCYTLKITCGSTSFRREEKRSIFYYGNRDENGNLCYCVRCGGYDCPGHTHRIYRYTCNGCGRVYDEYEPTVCTARTGYAPGCGREEEYICGMDEGQVLSSQRPTADPIISTQRFAAATRIRQGIRMGMVPFRSLPLPWDIWRIIC